MWVGCSPSKAGEGTACCSKVVEVSGKHTCKRVNPGLASWVTLATFLSHSGPQLSHL